MTRSNGIQPDFKIDDRAFGYDREEDSFRIADAKQSLFFSTMGDGGVYTSIDDYLRWITAIQQKSVLDPDLVREAQSAQFPIDTARTLSYGFGWLVAGSGDSKLVYHTGSNGGFRTIVLTKPSAKYAVVIFSNRTGVDLEDLVRVVNKIYGIDDKAFVKLEKPVMAMAVAAASLSVPASTGPRRNRQGTTIPADSTPVSYACGTRHEGSLGSAHATRVARKVPDRRCRSNVDAVAGHSVPPIVVRGAAREVPFIPAKVVFGHRRPALPKGVRGRPAPDAVI